MDTRKALVKRIEIHFDAYSDRKVIEYIESHPSKMKYIKDLIYKDYKRHVKEMKKAEAL